MELFLLLIVVAFLIAYFFGPAYLLRDRVDAWVVEIKPQIAVWIKSVKDKFRKKP